ncbi:MFS transporter [Ferroacidibacillus organovorans]|uniref:MFS transporter n=1 Tax=Ferroacidibacillus organovorans TaxID=1765683 RepID=A0A124IW63_9BACL|nr:MFS transporter [Ferroacidibacillus organovorans]KUO96436.1 MFS transporter [Ferroacidibacillus organovorans]
MSSNADSNGAPAPSGTHGHGAFSLSFFRQPLAVYAVAFACVIAFMGLGLVDPILPAISKQLHATPSQVELLFSSYNLVTGLAMVITGAVSSRIGFKPTLLTGLLIIVIFSALGGSSHSIAEIVWFRAGWGLGNALFIATALAVIVGVASGGTAGAIILYEAALGLGISVGPLLGGELGSISWRGPFYGVSTLMALAFILVSVLLKKVPRATRRSSVMEPFRALRHKGLLTMGITAFLYNFGFFTLLAYTPFVLNMDAHHLGYVFFGWGVALAVTSVFVAPSLRVRFGTRATLYGVLGLIALDLFVMGLGLSSIPLLVVCVIAAGALLGINNTVITTAVMDVSPFERPIASAAYSFVRFMGGAIAPWLSGKLAVWFNPHVPFYVGAFGVSLAVLTLIIGRRQLANV